MSIPLVKDHDHSGVNNSDVIQYLLIFFSVYKEYTINILKKNYTVESVLDFEIQPIKIITMNLINMIHKYRYVLHLKLH